MAQSIEKLEQCLSVILLGDVGAGKSASGNTILGRPAFSTARSIKTAKRSFQKESVTIDGVRVDVYDTPACLNIASKDDMSSDLSKILLQFDPRGPIVFLLVTKAGSYTEKEKKYVEEIEKRLGDWRLNTWILFTRGDEINQNNMTVEKWIEENEEIKRLVERFPNRYHIFDNKARKLYQVKKLLKAIKNAPLTMLPQMKSFPKRKYDKNNEIRQTRIVLLGKIGVGKSSTGNTILGEKRFISEFSLSSVTAESEKQQADVAGWNVSVVDTPGLFDTNLSAEELAVEIGRSVYLSSPGPHAFLYVVPLNVKFTDRDVEVVQRIEKIFGEKVRKNMIILFTYGEQLQEKDADAQITKNYVLKRLIDQCEGRYHIFNNNDPSNRQQVIELLKKIDRIQEQNKGSCYSNQMYEDAVMMEESSFLQKYWAHLFVGGVIGAITAPIAGVAIATGAIAGALLGLFFGLAGVRVKIKATAGTGEGVGIQVEIGHVKVRTGLGVRAKMNACAGTEGVGFGSEIRMAAGAGLKDGSVEIGAGLGVIAGFNAHAGPGGVEFGAGIEVGAGVGLRDGNVEFGAGLGVKAGFNAHAGPGGVAFGAGIEVGAGVGLRDGNVEFGAGLGVIAGFNAHAGPDGIGFGAGVGLRAGCVEARVGVKAEMNVCKGTVGVGAGVGLKVGDVDIEIGAEVGFKAVGPVIIPKLCIW